MISLLNDIIRGPPVNQNSQISESTNKASQDPRPKSMSSSNEQSAKPPTQTTSQNTQNEITPPIPCPRTNSKQNKTTGYTSPKGLTNATSGVSELVTNGTVHNESTQPITATQPHSTSGEHDFGDINCSEDPRILMLRESADPKTENKKSPKRKYDETFFRKDNNPDPKNENSQQKKNRR